MKKILLTLLTTLLLAISSITYAEDWVEVGEQDDSTIYVDWDSVRRLEEPDLTVLPSKNPLMYTVKLVKTDDSTLYSKYRVRTVVMYFNSLNQIDGRNYRLTKSEYLDDNGRLVQTYGTTDFSPIAKGSLGAVVDKYAKAVAVEKGL